MSLKAKKEYQDLLLSIINPLLKHFSPNKARIRLSGGGTTYTQDVIELEAFARPLWGLVPFWIGGGRNKELESIYIEGITNGTNPESPEYWGDCKDFDQRFVEMTPIAFGLLATPEILWNPLSDDAKNNLSSWLYQINNHDMARCNWLFFRILVNMALKARGRKFSQERIEEDLVFIESCYKGDGWYEDGVSRRTDYYSAFAMQYYSILYAIYGDGDKRVAEERAKLFSKDFMLWFSEDGTPLPYGRSLTYRFATAAFFSALALFEDVDYGRIKGIINRDLNYFLSKRIFSNDGILTVGYGYPNLTMAERYNAPGSPYWSLKVFLILALPDDHAFWKADEKPLEIDDGIYKLDRARMLIERSGGNVSSYVPGMQGMRSLGHFSDKYDKFVYSTSFPFSVSHTNETIMESSPDNMLAFEVDGYIYVRRCYIEYRLENDRIITSWEVPNAKIETEIIPFAGGHIRKHRIESKSDCKVYDSGYSIEQDSSFCTVEENGKVTISNSVYYSSIETKNKTATPSFIKADPNSNLVYINNAFPTMIYDIKSGVTLIEDIFYCGRK